jgi:3-hydroxy acid dehydrogenase/malonic semialdehyde reductase
MSLKRTVLITGASAGIGEACAHLFAKNNFRLIITARRQDRLEKLKLLLESEYQSEVHTLVFDVKNKEEVSTAINSLPTEWKKIDVLINNAGLSLGLDPIQNGNVDDWETMIDTNVKGLLYVSKIVSNGMIKNNSGHIINLGSIAGKESYPNGNVYCATKAAVDSLSKSMRMDLVQHGIKVTAIHPGAVETEFSIVRFKGDVERANNVYKGFEPLHPEDVAEVIYFAASRPSHVNINDMLVMPTAQASATIINRVVE